MGKIQNIKELATTKLRQDALQIAEAGLGAIDTAKIISSSIKISDGKLCVNDENCALADSNNIFVVGVGKCAGEAAEALEHILKDKLTAGVVIGIEGQIKPNLKRINYFTGTHPSPSDQNMAAAKLLVHLLDHLTEKDLVIVIISGGGSTLLCMPESDTCVEEKMILEKLTNLGATIAETNTVRKHLSLARGGNLAKSAYPAQVISLIFSDVPGNDLQFIASGPTIKDSTTSADAKNILDKYKIDHVNIIETPKDNKYFEHVKNILLVTNDTALKAMADISGKLGYRSEICNSCISGEARMLGAQIATDLHDCPPATVRLYGGESTVTLKGPGKGGRNQELALGALINIKSGELIMSLATDGQDNSIVAGAIVDYELKQHIDSLSLKPEEYLEQNNSFEFFKHTNGQIITGQLGSNVSDIVVALK